MLDINLIINHSSDIKNKLLSRGYELSLNKLAVELAIPNNKVLVVSINSVA